MAAEHIGDGPPAQRALIVGAVATDDPVEHIETVSAAAFPRLQIRGTFASVLLGRDAVTGAAALQRLVAHNCAVHLAPGGSLAVNHTTPEFAAHLEVCGFTQVAGSGGRTFWRRTERRTVNDIVAEARSRLDRLSAPALQRILPSPDTVVVDVRIPDDRRLHGVIPGSLPIPRSTLEWRADPTSGYAHDGLGDFDARVVLVCNEGYSSSIAAATLQDLGYHRATDLVGGMVAWNDAGMPVVSSPAAADDVFAGPVEST